MCWSYWSCRTWARPDACRVAFDKPTAKAVVRAAGLSTPEWVVFPEEAFHNLGGSTLLERIINRLGLPLYVKPARGGLSLGASGVYRAEDLPAAMVECFAHSGTALVERCVTGIEVAAGVLDFGNDSRALPPWKSSR